MIESLPFPVSYVQQRSDDITYYLVAGPAPRDAVRVLVEQRIALPGGNVVLAIIGSSHFLQFSAGDAVMTEMLASPHPSLEVLPLMARTGVVSGSRHDLERDGVAYSFELRRRGCSPAELREETARLTVAAPNRLSYLFPSNGGKEGALTCLEWQLRGSRMTVETYHTYPGEPAIVLTRSVVELPERGDAP